MKKRFIIYIILFCTSTVFSKNARVFYFEQHVVMINKIQNRIKESSCKYADLDTVFSEKRRKDTIYWNIIIYKKKIYKQYLNNSNYKLSKLKKEKVNNFSVKRLDSNVIKFDSLFQLDFIGSNFKIEIKDKSIIKKDEKLFFFTSGIIFENTYKIKIFKNTLFNYIGIFSLIKQNTDNQEFVGWLDCFWYINEEG
jgi:hypothetical protein